MRSSAPSGPIGWFAGRRLAVGSGVLLAVVVAFGALLTQRSLARPLGPVQASLPAVATADLTVDSDVEAGDQVGRTAAELRTAQQHLRGMVASVAAPSEAVAAAVRSCGVGGADRVLG